MLFTNVNLDIEKRVGYMTINNPPVNALNEATMYGLSDCFDYIQQHQDIKVVVLSGIGKVFVAGADIHELKAAFDDVKQAEKIAKKGQDLFNRIERFDRPVIAAIHGACLGGGLELAMSCHMRIVSKKAKLGLPETNLGIIPGFGGTQRLPRLTNKAKALELILTGKLISGTEAERIGLANYSVDENQLQEEAKKLAEVIALEKSTLSIAAAIHTVSKVYELSYEEGQSIEARQFGQLFLSNDAKEGINAFTEKRKPEFMM